MKKFPWEEYPEIWKTKSAFMSFVRGGIRRGLWERNPIKLKFIQNNRKRVALGKVTKTNIEGMVWGCKCSECKKDFKQSECQVDHRKGNNSLKSIEDLREFIESMILITEDDLAIVCKNCHKIKTHAERKGISFKEATDEKKAIQFVKLPKELQIQFLQKGGFKLKDINNSTNRRKCFMELIRNHNGIIIEKGGIQWEE